MYVCSQDLVGMKEHARRAAEKESYRGHEQDWRETKYGRVDGLE